MCVWEDYYRRCVEGKADVKQDLEGKNLLVQMRESDELFNCEKRKDSYEEHLLVESFDELIEYIDKGDDYEED